jgi:acylphosphatase
MYLAFPLNITGFVEYAHSEGIVIEAEGSDEDLEQFIAGLRSLVQTFKISDISISEIAPKGYSFFEIRNISRADETIEHISLLIRCIDLFSWKMRRMFGYDKRQNTQLK